MTGSAVLWTDGATSDAGKRERSRRSLVCSHLAVAASSGDVTSYYCPPCLPSGELRYERNRTNGEGGRGKEGEPAGVREERVRIE